jgi:hypothetical protein
MSNKNRSANLNFVISFAPAWLYRKKTGQFCKGQADCKIALRKLSVIWCCGNVSRFKLGGIGWANSFNVDDFCHEVLTLLFGLKYLKDYKSLGRHIFGFQHMQDFCSLRRVT